MNLDWRDIKGEIAPSGYGPGKHLVKFGEWKFDETKNGSVFLQMNFEKDGVARPNCQPFTSCRLFFTTENAVRLSRHYLHRLCDKMKIEYSEERVATGEAILRIGTELQGREVEIELKPTGGKNQKGYDYLGVSIEGVGDLFIKEKAKEPEVEYQLTNQEISEDLDIPF